MGNIFFTIFISITAWVNILSSFAFTGTHAMASLKEHGGVHVAARSPWESRGGKQGVTLKFPTELALLGGELPDPFPALAVDQVHDSACGHAFVNVTSVTDVAFVRTSQPCILIVKGFVAIKLQNMGVQKDRTVETTITLHDAKLDAAQVRAVTLINLAGGRDNYVVHAADEMAVAVKQDPKLVILAELRQSDVSERNWCAYRDCKAFDMFINQVICQECIAGTFVLHKTTVKDAYLVKRIQISHTDRDNIYTKSGKVGITFKQARSIFDPDEKDIEVLRLQTTDKKDIEATYAALVEIPGFRGVFVGQGQQFVRIDDSELEVARKIVCDQDDRFCPETMGMKLTHRFRVQGLPSGITNASVISTLAEWHWRVVPLQVFHVSELAVAIVGSDSYPSSYHIPTSCGHLLVEKLERRGPKAKKTIVKESGASSSGADSAPTSDISQIRPRNLLANPRPSAPDMSQQGSFMSPFANSLAGKVKDLEEKVANITGDIVKLQDGQNETRNEIHALRTQQDTGFSSLMSAIGDLKKMQESVLQTSSPSKAASPPAKVPRTQGS